VLPTADDEASRSTFIAAGPSPRPCAAFLCHARNSDTKENDMSGLSNQDRARKWFEETRRIHLSPNPDLHKVVAGYRKSLELMPGDPQVIYHLGLALLGKREWSNAEEQFRKALRLQPQMPEANYHLGQALLQQRRAEEAEQCFRKAIDGTAKENRGPLYFTLAMALQGQYEQLAARDRKQADAKLKQAEECFRLGLEQQPEDPAGLFQFALFLQNISTLPGHESALDEAERLLDGLLARQPEQRDALNLRALLHSRRQQYAEAVALLEQAVALAPGDAGLLFNLAQMTEQGGDHGRARVLLEKCLEIQPRQPGALSRLAGIIAQHERDWARATALVDQGLELAPRDPVLLYQKALIIKEQSAELPEEERAAALAESRALAELALEAQPGFQPAQALLAALGGGPTGQAAPGAAELEELERQLAERPQDATLKDKVLQGRLAARRMPEALALIEDLLRERPDDRALRINHGLVLSYVAGQDGARIVEARDSLRRGIEGLDEPDSPVLLRLAQLDIMLREPEEAADQLAVLRGRHPGDTRLDEAQLLQLSGVAAQQKGLMAESADFFRAAAHLLDTRQAQGGQGTMLESALRESWGSLAQVLDLLRREDEAIEAHRRWCQVAPRDGNAYFRLSAIYNRNRRFEEGLETLRRLEEIAPENPVTYFYLGLTLTDLSRHTEAESCLMKALELKPDFPEAQQRLQYLQQNRPLVAASIEELEQSVKDDPEDLDDRLLLGQAYLAAREWEKAAQQLEVVAAGDAKNHKALFDLSNAWLAAGERDKAIDCLIRLEERLPTDPGIRFRLAELLLDNEEEELAVKEYKNAVDMQPNNPVFQFRYGVALKAADREDKAEQAIRRALELQQSFPAAHHELGLLEYTSERHEAALKSFVTAFQQDQRNFQALYYCGLIQVAKHNEREARKFFQSALGINPEHGESHFQLGRLFLLAGRPADARRHLSRALEIWPEDAFNRPQAEHLLEEAGKA
jgi:tetratricopeptide (TPR) repeat protein